MTASFGCPCNTPDGNGVVTEGVLTETIFAFTASGQTARAVLGPAKKPVLMIVSEDHKILQNRSKPAYFINPETVRRYNIRHP